MISKPQADNLVTLLCAARPHGARRWDPTTVYDALARVRHIGLAEVCIAAMRAAADEGATPAAIADLTSDYWRPLRADLPPTLPPTGSSELCGICSLVEHECRARAGEHPYAPRRHARAAAPEWVAVLRGRVLDESA